MFNYEDLLASLQDGETAEELAEKFTQALNRASQEKEELDKKNQEEEQLNAELEAYQINWTRSIIAALAEYVSKVYPESAEKYNEMVGEITDDQCLDICLQVDSMLQLMMLFGKFGF